MREVPIVIPIVLLLTFFTVRAQTVTFTSDDIDSYWSSLRRPGKLSHAWTCMTTWSSGMVYNKNGFGDLTPNRQLVVSV